MQGWLMMWGLVLLAALGRFLKQCAEAELAPVLMMYPWQDGDDAA